MGRIQFRLFAIVAAIFVAATAYSAPKYQLAQENSIVIREMRGCIDEMRHEMNNHESEIRTFEEKLANQEVIIEALREQNLNMSKTNQDTTKNVLANLEMKVNSLDTSIKGLTADFRELKNYANESAGKTRSYAEKVIEIEKALTIQSSNLGQLQSALSSLMNILEVKHDLASSEVSSDKTHRTHRVQSGDSLAKIAKAYNTSIKLIKEVNNLSSDRIVIGQNIKIP